MTKEKMLKGLKWFFFSFIWLFVLFLVVDIVTKNIIMANLEVGDQIVLIPNFLAISYVQNFKAAFGIGYKGANADTVNRVIYLVVASAATIAITFFYIKKFKSLNKLYRACIMLILVGAVGNIIDRLFYAQNDFAVVDWIDFFGIWSYNFNIADSCVVVGAFILIIYMIVEEIKEVKVKREQELAEIKAEKDAKQAEKVEEN
ncbi:MAG: signal peptidase II, partial [Bacilli bacterium]|nr:signal peptidase II [Bacilli bacterium]